MGIAIRLLCWTLMHNSRRRAAGPPRRRERPRCCHAVLIVVSNLRSRRVPMPAQRVRTAAPGRGAVLALRLTCAAPPGHGGAGRRAKRTATQRSVVPRHVDPDGLCRASNAPNCGALDAMFRTRASYRRGSRVDPHRRSVSQRLLHIGSTPYSRAHALKDPNNEDLWHGSR
jgi:hypothetical protein